MRRLLVTASVVPSSPILVALMKEALSSSETSILTRSTLRNIPEDAIPHSHHRENLKSYIVNVILYVGSLVSYHKILDVFVHKYIIWMRHVAFLAKNYGFS
jgi:hypothetical protein